MVFSCLLFAINFLFFKFFALQYGFWVTNFWEYIGFAIFAILLLVFIKPYRKSFINVFKKNKLPVIVINGTSEVINIISKFFFNLASLLAPMILV